MKQLENQFLCRSPRQTLSKVDDDATIADENNINDEDEEALSTSFDVVDGGFSDFLLRDSSSQMNLPRQVQKAVQKEWSILHKELARERNLGKIVASENERFAGDDQRTIVGLTTTVYFALTFCSTRTIRLFLQKFIITRTDTDSIQTCTRKAKSACRCSIRGTRRKIRKDGAVHQVRCRF